MLKDDVDRYIELRRAMGFKLRVQSGLLHSFATFATQRGDGHVRTETVLAWSAQAPSATQRRNRLQVVRGFARQLKAEDERHEVPPADAFGRPKRTRRMPHIYSSDEIRRLLEAAFELTPRGSIRPMAYGTLIALLAAAGLRVSEALALQLDDVTPSGLVVRCTKFRKSRLVPLHPTAKSGLDRYLALRAQISSADRSVFVSLRGTAIAYQTVNAVFLGLARSIGMRREAKSGPGPRLHDLRHTFAVRALESCRGDESEIRRHILALSTYLGHAHPSDTYWYLHATPKLMAEIACAGEALFNGGEA
jgi:integrase